MPNPIHLTIPALSVFLCAPLYAALEFTDNDGTLEIRDGDSLVTAFRTDYRVPYLYPLTSPSGANIARHWPMEKDAASEEKDHPHHRGLWFSHGNVNGYDFWANFDKKNPSIILNSITAKKVEDGTASFTASLTWTAEKRELLDEDRSFSISRPNPETLRIDVTSTLTALEDEVLFKDTKEGTFAIRMDRSLRVKGPEAKSTLINSNGEKNLDAWGKRADWAAYEGPDEKGEPTVVAIIDNPGSFRHPTHWHARDYGLLAANPFGIHDFEKKKDKSLGDHLLRKGETLVFKHTVIVHHGTLESAKLEEISKSLPK